MSGAWEAVDFGAMQTDGTAASPSAPDSDLEPPPASNPLAPVPLQAPQSGPESDTAADGADDWQEFLPCELEAEVRTESTRSSCSSGSGGSGRWSGSARGSTSVQELARLENDLFDHDALASASQEDLRKSIAAGAAHAGDEEALQSQQRRRRFLAAEELLKTEREYSSYLNVLVEVYLEPLLQLCSRKRSGSRAAAARLLRASAAGVGGGSETELTAERVGKVFCVQELGLLRALSEELFLALAKKMRDWSPDQTVGDVFLRLGDFLKLYAQYCSNYESAITEYTTLFESCPVFRDFVTAADADEKSLNHRLKNYLIMPVQRPPRYALLLAALLKYTDKEHPDYALLSDALEKIQVILNHVNSSVNEEEARQKVVEIQARLKKIRLVEPHRTYVHDGHLVSLNNSPSKLHCYLFNDIFVTARTARVLGQEYEEVQRRLALETAWMVADASGDPRLLGKYAGRCAFLFLTPYICYVFQCPSEDVRDKWTSAIGAAIEDLLLRNPANVEVRRQYRPQWRYGSWRVVKRNDLTHRGTLETTRKAVVERICSTDEAAAAAMAASGELSQGETQEGSSAKLKKKFNQLAGRFSRVPAADSRRMVSQRTLPSSASPAGTLYSPLGAPPPLPPRSQQSPFPLRPALGSPSDAVAPPPCGGRDLSPGSGMNPKPPPSPGPPNAL